MLPNIIQACEVVGSTNGTGITFSIADAIISLLQVQDTAVADLVHKGISSGLFEPIKFKKNVESSTLSRLESSILCAMPEHVLVNFIHPNNEKYLADSAKPKSMVHVTALQQSLQSAYNFALASVAGAIGATFVYPIGLHFS